MKTLASNGRWVDSILVVFLIAGWAMAAGGQESADGELDRKRIDTFRQEKRYLQQRIDELEDELDQMAGAQPDRDLQDRLDQAIQENKILRESVRQQQTELDALEDVALQLRKVEARERRLETELEEFRLRNQRQVETLDSLRPTLEELNRAQADLAARDRQIRHLQLALKGVEHEANVIAQLKEARRGQVAEASRLREERDSALIKVREAADILQQMRTHLSEARSAQAEAESAQVQENDRVRDLAARSKEDQARIAELSEQVEQLVMTVNAIQMDRELLAERLASMQELETELDEVVQARILVERRAAEAEAQALRAAGTSAEATKRIESLLDQIRTLEQECEALRAQPGPPEPTAEEPTAEAPTPS